MRKNLAEDCQRRTLATARRSANWQRLIDTIHLEQGKRGYESRQFAPDVMRYFGETLIGFPREHVTGDASTFAAYWVVRQVSSYMPAYRSGESGHSFVRYVLKAVYGDDLANVHTIADESHHCDFDAEDFSEPGTYGATPNAEQRAELRAWDESTARAFVARKNHQFG